MQRLEREYVSPTLSESQQRPEPQLFSPNQVDATKLLYSHLVLPTIKTIEAILRTITPVDSPFPDLVKSISLRAITVTPLPSQLLDDLILRAWSSLERLVSPRTISAFWLPDVYPRVEYYEGVRRSFSSIAPIGARPLTLSSKVWRRPLAVPPAPEANIVSLQIDR